MNKRQENLFLHIIKEYINTAIPVGSNSLVEKYKMDVSSATIRNDMAALEQEGLVHQPHVSAGRVPTEKGYKYFIQNYVHSKDVAKKDMALIENASKIKVVQAEHKIKNIAKVIAELTSATAIIAFGKNNVYYTGISNLFSQPEFSDMPTIYSMSEVVDHLDEVISNIYDRIQETEIKVGNENYFSNSCSSILLKTKGKLFGVIGPMRMDYQRNLGLVNYFKKIIK